MKLQSLNPIGITDNLALENCRVCLCLEVHFSVQRPTSKQARHLHRSHANSREVSLALRGQHRAGSANDVTPWPLWHPFVTVALLTFSVRFHCSQTINGRGRIDLQEPSRILFIYRLLMVTLLTASDPCKCAVYIYKLMYLQKNLSINKWVRETRTHGLAKHPSFYGRRKAQHDLLEIIRKGLQYNTNVQWKCLCLAMHNSRVVRTWIHILRQFDCATIAERLNGSLVQNSRQIDTQALRWIDFLNIDSFTVSLYDALLCHNANVTVIWKTMALVTPLFKNSASPALIELLNRT